MSSPAEHRRDARRFAVERSLAPHVEAGWAEDLILELRLLGMSGDQIGSALSEVESHCAESGEPAADAFGDAREYARSLGLEPRTDVSGRALLRSTGPVVVDVLGMMVLLWGFTAWRQGERLGITAGEVVGLALFVVSVLALVRWSDVALRLAIHRPVLLWFALMVSASVGAAAAVIGRGVLVEIGAGWGMSLGAAAILGAAGWRAARRSASGSTDDPITSPFGATRPSVESGTSGPAVSTASRRLAVLAAHPEALIPVWTVLMLAVTWWLTR